MLEELRNKINAVDDKLLKLYLERMAIAKEVSLAKAVSGAPVDDPERERQVLLRLTEGLDDDMKLYVKQLYGAVFETSKAYQMSLYDVKSPFERELAAALEKGTKPFPVKASVACQGVMGAYSCIAADKLFPISSITCFKNWDGVFAAVEKGLCEFGVLPIENSAAGSVSGVYDLMRKHSFHIARCIKLRVKHYLLAPKGVKAEDVKEIISHDQAISQCGEFLKNFGDVKITRCDNTALAAKLVAESGRKDFACISSKDCADIYGLDVLRAGVNDNDGNYTRFIAIEKGLEIFEGARKISLAVNLAHEAGSLNRLLNKFATLGLNLTKLESRPIPGSQFEFAFYFDFEADVRSLQIRNLLSEISLTSEGFEFLGAYEEI